MFAETVNFLRKNLLICLLFLGKDTSLIAQCSLLTAHRSQLITHCSSLTAHQSLLINHCSSLTAHHSLLTAHCSSITAHRSLLTAHCPLLAIADSFFLVIESNIQYKKQKKSIIFQFYALFCPNICVCQKFVIPLQSQR